MRLITVHVPEYYLDGLHELIRQKRYPHRSECIRAAIRDLLKTELKEFQVNQPDTFQPNKCSSCGSSLHFAEEEGVYFCASCKSFYSPSSG